MEDVVFLVVSVLDRGNQNDPLYSRPPGSANHLQTLRTLNSQINLNKNDQTRNHGRVQEESTTAEFMIRYVSGHISVSSNVQCLGIIEKVL